MRNLANKHNARVSIELAHTNVNTYYVYILTNRSGTLYTGITNNLLRRMYEHKSHMNQGFTARYNIDRLAYFEETDDVYAAIAREKQIKGCDGSAFISLLLSTRSGTT